MPSMEKEIDKNLTPIIEEEEEIIREVRVQTSKRKEKKEKKRKKYIQYFIQIPAPIIEELNIEKGDIFIFKVPLNKKEYSIKLKKEIK